MAVTTGIGTKLYKWSGSSWEALAQITDISGPGASRETIDTTTLDTTGGYRTFIAGLRDSGTVSFTMNFTRDAYELMKDDFESDDLQDYMIELPDSENTTFHFQGLVTEMPLTIPTGDKITADVTIQISGQVTIESGSQTV